jgi:V8-like Glu-specific endopeptidase
VNQNNYISALLICICCFTQLTQAQQAKHPEKCIDPYSLLDICSDYTKLNFSDIQKPPYSYVVHVCVKKEGDKERFGTGAIISNNALITAQHVVSGGKIEYIEFCVPTLKNGDRWQRFKPDEFLVNECDEIAEADLAIISIVNKEKNIIFHKGHFEFADSSFTSAEEQSSFNISGFPCTLFSHQTGGSDTMLNRSFTSGFNSIPGTTRSIYMPACTFPGDSGSPLWRKVNNRFCIGMVVVQRGNSDKNILFQEGKKVQ